MKNIPLDEIEGHVRDIVETVGATGESVIVSQRGHPDAIVMRHDDYSALVARTNEGNSNITRRDDIAAGEPIVGGTRTNLIDRRRSPPRGFG